MNNELVPQPSWWKRNWKWVVPVGGCFTLIIGAIIVFSSLYFGISNIMEESQPYEYALELLNKDEALLEVLGSPIEKDGMFQGNISWTNGNKIAKIIVPIAGPKGEGKLYIDASGQGEDWIYHEIRVEVNEQEFDFLNESGSEF
ncbi:cytochrome c oxidase assembly factor Coa1 family protein [uncultured Croceitalea sp.]|uniref:cytochrome c oxidase assembly factor Coa1 family protein n=1 Tax=uncultured Croceitalea sp. TaxID=1798908 RepID=UPI00330627D9